MIGKLVLRYLAFRPVRSAVFVGAYAAGVSVMLALLSIGEVMVEQARDEQWIGGGEVTVLPAGVDLETLRLGGAVFYGLEQARFLAREVLGGPRLAGAVSAVAPWIDDRAIYLRARGQSEAVAVRASGMVPSAARALDALAELRSGTWEDSDLDRRWLSPTRFELYSEIDRFHRPPARLQGDTTWAEWHYFNLLWPDEARWLYLSYILAGDVSGARGDGGGGAGGVVLARYRTPDGGDRTYADSVGPQQVRYSLNTPDLSLGPHTVRLIDNPARYRMRARLPATDGGPPLEIDLEMRPGAHRYFPPTELAAADSFVSGYVVPALRAEVRGRVCVGDRCQDAAAAVGYHDHNWGTWGGVLWDWGVVHAGDLDVLYGGVHGSASEATQQRSVRFLVYSVDSLGVSAALQMAELRYSGRRLEWVAGDSVGVPERLAWSATRGADSLAAEIAIEQSSLSRLTLSGDHAVYLAQMQGTVRLTGELGGRSISAQGPGFLETFVNRAR